MPKELTHWALAEEALHRLPADSRLKGLIHDQRELYLVGAVLPDTLLHLFYGPWSRQALLLADQFHDTAANSFQPLIEVERRFPGSLPAPLLACLLGVISHMLADCVLHPFVYAVSGSGEIGRHYRLETDIDCYVAHRGRIGFGRRLADLVGPEARVRLVELLGMLFDPRGTLPREALERALALHCRLQGMYGVPAWQIVTSCLALVPVRFFRRNRELFYPLSGAGVRGAACALPRPWRHPVTGREERATLDDLLSAAVTAMVEHFERIGHAGCLAAALQDPPGANLLTGSYGVRLADARFISAEPP
ncbi:zinc dependent phospholipase C family protein [Trichlorobacter ammonificans]|uniref:Zn_dep_PLPC domain-containing protein n=1 Tax=Trichlorobacter ammonificans TaxID=2916410 RepID=A0ABM9D811_9BACT|nr:zinc dependent phospholipase C family protein [Trichlorobacter ammonificans]CAH2030530.1 Zn_dep_PLPC domain-containing protein [Trichlorobacter ammonificans]